MLCVDILAVPHIRKVRSTALLEASNRGKETTPQKIRQLVKVTAPMSNIAKSECHDVKHCTQALMERDNQEREDTARFQLRAEPRPGLYYPALTHESGNETVAHMLQDSTMRTS